MTALRRDAAARTRLGKRYRTGTPAALPRPLHADTYTHMKTTVEIAPELLRAAKAVATKEHTTLRALLEEGLRWALRRRKQPREFELRDASVSGKGTQPGVREGDWNGIRDTIYDGRGA